MNPLSFRLEDAVWEEIELLLPPRRVHPCGAHNPRISDRAAMEVIVVVLAERYSWMRTAQMRGMSPSSVYRRFREWSNAGVIQQIAAMGLIDELRPPVQRTAKRIESPLPLDR
jgi:transposase